MRWFIGRAALLWLTLIGLCIAGVMLSRADSGPDTLQQIGFDVCGGEPCFRGIKAGADWRQVMPIFPPAVDTERDFMRGLRIGKKRIFMIRISTTDEQTVDSIWTVGNPDPPLYSAITTGEFITR